MAGPREMSWDVTARVRRAEGDVETGAGPAAVMLGFLLSSALRRRS